MLPRQEMLTRETSSFFVVLPAYAAFHRVALVFSCLFRLFQLVAARGRESVSERRGEAVVISCLFQLSPARGQVLPARGPELGRPTEGRGEACGRSLCLLPFRRMLSLFHLVLSLFHLVRSGVRPARLSVEQVVVQRPYLVFDRSKSSQKR
jgi:hypothetical protein